MQITKPVGLRRCDNRNVTAKINSVTGGPEQWFTYENLKCLGYSSFSFDFFVNWSKGNFNKTLWYKRFIDIPVSLVVKEDNWQESIVAELLKCEGEDYLIDLYSLGNVQSLHTDFLIFNEDSWSPEQDIIYARLEENLTFKVKIISIMKLKKIIRDATGQDLRISSKGLIYSTSKLECYLSKTKTPYPGDADLVLANDNYNKFIIIEFKKHNLNTSISQQRLSNYYPSKDKKKYDRLQILRERLPNSRLYTVYYTTDSRHQTKLELNSYNDWGLGEWSVLEIASPDSVSNQQQIEAYLRTCLEFFEQEVVI